MKEWVENIGKNYTNEQQKEKPKQQQNAHIFYFKITQTFTIFCLL